MNSNDILLQLNQGLEKYPYKTDKDGMTTWHHSFVHSISRLSIDGEVVYDRK